MKQRKMTKKQHKENVSIITFVMIIITVGITLTALVMSVDNRISFLKTSKETNNSLIMPNEMAKSVDLEVASSVATNAGNVSLNVKTNSTNPKSFKEYRYYIKESTNDIYVLDAIKIEEQHAYVKLEPNTIYDVKVEAVSHGGSTMTSITSGVTPVFEQ